MKKSVLVLGILVVAIGVASAQEIEPVRIEGGFSAGSITGSAEYILPIKSLSLGIDFGVIYIPSSSGSIIGGETTLRLYPLNSIGEGLYTSIGYALDLNGDSIPATHYANLCIGYRFNFLRVATLRVGAGYQVRFSELEGDRLSQFVPDITLGFAF